MTGTVHTKDPAYSRLTFALLEDTGWYRPNYEYVSFTRYTVACLFGKLLELRQYKTDSIKFIKIAVLKLPRFGDEKERQFQNWHFFRLNGVVLSSNFCVFVHTVTKCASYWKNSIKLLTVQFSQS